MQTNSDHCKKSKRCAMHVRSKPCVRPHSLRSSQGLVFDFLGGAELRGSHPRSAAGHPHRGGGGVDLGIWEGMGRQVGSDVSIKRCSVFYVVFCFKPFFGCVDFFVLNSSRKTICKDVAHIVHLFVQVARTAVCTARLA